MIADIALIACVLVLCALIACVLVLCALSVFLLWGGDR